MSWEKIGGEVDGSLLVYVGLGLFYDIAHASFFLSNENMFVNSHLVASDYNTLFYSLVKNLP